MKEKLSDTKPDAKIDENQFDRNVSMGGLMRMASWRLSTYEKMIDAMLNGDLTVKQQEAIVHEIAVQIGKLGSDLGKQAFAIYQKSLEVEPQPDIDYLPF